jgi:prolyl-tRNA editing enzyme YbaK/EbsC (Cys-tRNA(Pro) deacylase)
MARRPSGVFNADSEGRMSESHVEQTPPTVSRALEFFRRTGIWHTVSRNDPVRSCAEAAAHRRRCDRVGIPLHDELKSLLYRYETGDHSRKYVLLHCRGHQRVDVAEVSVLLRSVVRPVPRQELREQFGADYGTVTPALFAECTDVCHVVDVAVLRELEPPFTMMTNAGDLEHAVEFRPAELFAVLPRTVEARIAVPGS